MDDNHLKSSNVPAISNKFDILKMECAFVPHTFN